MIPAVSLAALALVPVLGLAPPPPSTSPIAAADCDPVAVAALDSLLGDWQVEWIDARTPDEPRHGSSTVEAVANGCAVEERLRLDDGYEEVRLFAFDAEAGYWQLALVDSGHGNLLVLRGHRIDSGLEFLSTHQRTTALLVDRVRFRRAGTGWKYTVDAAPGYGEAWRPVLAIQYTRPRG